MENKKDISFIIPVFNTKQDQIIRCLDSVIKIKSSIETEIIVVDDGSLPENSKIYKKLVNKYNGIYLYEENSGGLVLHEIKVYHMQKGNMFSF